jgi:hypothetical protein
MAAAILTHARLRELLDYNAETGVFTWRVSRQGHCKAGSAAGARRHDGYIRICVDQRRVWGHRLAWFYVHGEWPSQQIDHINGNPSDNRMCNLRDVAPRTNMENERRARRRKNGGSLLGAHWSTTWERWKSSIITGGKQIHIGWFDTEQQAHDAYIAAKRRLHPGCTI